MSLAARLTRLTAACEIRWLILSCWADTITGRWALAVSVAASTPMTAASPTTTPTVTPTHHRPVTPTPFHPWLDGETLRGARSGRRGVHGTFTALEPPGAGHEDPESRLPGEAGGSTAGAVLLQRQQPVQDRVDRRGDAQALTLARQEAAEDVALEALAGIEVARRRRAVVEQLG